MNERRVFKEIEPHETVVADYCTVDFCEHGHAAIRLFWDGREAPFAAAYLGPDAVVMLAAEIAQALITKGRA